MLFSPSQALSGTTQVGLSHCATDDTAYRYIFFPPPTSLELCMPDSVAT